MNNIHINIKTETNGHVDPSEILYRNFLITKDHAYFEALYKQNTGLLIDSLVQTLSKNNKILWSQRISFFKDFESSIKTVTGYDGLMKICFEAFVTHEELHLNSGKCSITTDEMNIGVMSRFFVFLNRPKSLEAIEVQRKKWKRDFKFLLANQFQEYYFHFVKRFVRRHFGKNSSISNHIKEQCLEGSDFLDVPEKVNFDLRFNIDYLQTLLKEHLSKNEYLIFQLKEIEGYSSIEIGKMIGISDNAVDQTTKRYKRKNESIKNRLVFPLHLIEFFVVKIIRLN